MVPYHVGILGATGMVGQRLVERLAAHPWFRVVAVCGSDRSAGRPYGEVVRWSRPGDPPPAVACLQVGSAEPAALAGCDLVLSGLDGAIAGPIESACAAAGLAVVSNSSAHRLSARVPLVVPEVNGSHLALLDAGGRSPASGYVVTNPNCTVTGLALALAPLHRAFGVRRTVVATLQALSGAGLDGPRAVEMLDNVIPHIAGEEGKIEGELGKILGRVAGDRVEAAALVVAAHCHRVPVLEGHLASLSVELERAASPEAAVAALRAFRGEPLPEGLPSAPERCLIVRDEADRPQPRLDRDTGAGMSVVVGRVRACPVLGLRLVVLSHNTVRGAAGGTLLNAELLAASGRLPRRGAR
jgi:aspartate-semialdehyde dehydrogenase